MTVSLLIVATNKYVRFLPGLIESAEKHFLSDFNIVYHIFSDLDFEYKHPFAHVHKIEHKPWPHPTLKRFHFFKQHESKLQHTDYLFYIDADTLFQAPITEEILSESTAVRHCGFIGVRGSYETNPKSTSYVHPSEGQYYFGGGFWGFSKMEFWKFVNKAVEMVDIDEKNGIIPVHHDESILNRYLIDNPPAMVLNPSYHYPQSELEYYRKIWKGDYECKILLLDKKHEEVRV